MNKVNRAFQTLLLSALLALILTPARVQAQDLGVVDEIVAVVGGEIVLQSDVNALVKGIMQQQQVPYSDALWSEALGQIINQKVLTVQAEKDTTIIVTDDQVEQSLNQRINQLAAQVGGEGRLEDMYGKSVIQVKDDLRGEFKDRLLAEQFQSRKMQSISITPSEVKAWFARFPSDSLPTLPATVRIAHIVRYPAITEEAREDAMDIITAIRDSVVNGTATIEDYAQRFSDDPGSAGNGGAYTGSRLNELAPEFAAVAARIPTGEISQPFETQFGLHILRVNDRRGDVVDFNHILIAFDESKSDGTEAMAYLNTVRDSLIKYEMPFELMARRHSEEQMSAIRGGRVVDPQSLNRDLPLQALSVAWRTTINALEEGEISQPTEVDLLDGKRAFHILLLQRKVPSHRVDIITDYEQIRQIALQEKQQRELGEWLSNLRKDVYIGYRGKAASMPMASR